MPHILIVDSGVDPSRLGRIAIGKFVALRERDGCIVERATLRDTVGHGTACALIASQAAPMAVLNSIQILAQDGATSLPHLVHAVAWAVESRIDVVNLSLGTRTASPELEQACQQAADAGVILVAAEHNDGLVSYPAHLPTTIGVRGGKIHGDDAYHYHPGAPIECVARGDAQRVRWLGGDLFLGGSSFAAPRITATVARLKAEYPDAGLEEIRELLKQRAARVVSAGPTKATVSRGPSQEAAKAYPWMQRAALYPFTKEMHAFVRFADLLDFEIAGIADPPGRGLVGKDAGESIGTESTNLAVGARLAEATVTAGALELGYLGQLGSLRGRDLHREHLEHALDRGLHVFSFEPLEPRHADLCAAAKKRGLRFVWPAVTPTAAADVLRGQPAGGAVDVPVLGVVGTSSSQGKFTLQLMLRRHLQRRGYQLGQLGTEHHARLFGMDEAFPIGYAATVEADLASYPELLDRLLRRICWERRPDLLVVGSQSGTIPFDLHDHRTLSLSTLAFLMGVKPDACVLVVNDIDPEEHIDNTIQALRAVVGSEVLALAVSDVTKEARQRHGRLWTSHRRLPEAQLRVTTRRLEGRFGMPAVTISSARDVERLVTLVEEHFTEEEAASCQRKSA